MVIIILFVGLLVIAAYADYCNKLEKQSQADMKKWLSEFTEDTNCEKEYIKVETHSGQTSYWCVIADSNCIDLIDYEDCDKC